MIKNTGKVWHTARLLCLVLLLSLCSSFWLFLPASATGNAIYGSWLNYKGTQRSFANGYVQVPLQGLNNNVYDGTYTVWGSSSNQPVGNKNEDFVATASVIVETTYSQNNRTVVEISCPVVAWRLNSSSCDSSVVEQVFGDKHYAVYSFIMTGQFTDDVSPTQFQTVMNVVNNSNDWAYLYFTPLQVSFGQGELYRLGTINGHLDNIETILQSLNIQDYSTLLQNIRNGVTTMSNYLYDIRTYSGDTAQNSWNILQSLDDISTDISDQSTQDAQDRQDAEDAIQDAQDAADDTADDFNDSSQSLLSAMGTVVGLVRDSPATNCQIPVNDLGPDGVFDLGNVDICSIPNDIKQVLNRVFGLVMIVASAFLAWNVFNMGLNLLSQAMGYGYNIPKGVD